MPCEHFFLIRILHQPLRGGYFTGGMVLISVLGESRGPNNFVSTTESGLYPGYYPPVTTRNTRFRYDSGFGFIRPETLRCTIAQTVNGTPYHDKTIPSH